MKCTALPFLPWIARAMAAFVLAAPAFGQTTWTGASNNQWSDAANWNPSGVPSLTNPVIFDNAGNGNTVIDLGTSPTNLMVTFNPGAAAYTIGTEGQTFVLPMNYDYPQITVNAGVTNDQTFAANIEFYMSQVVQQQISFFNNSSAALTFSGATISAPHSYPSQFGSAIYLGGNGTGTNTISSAMNLPGPNIGIQKSGTGTWQLLNPTNTFMATGEVPYNLLLREGTLVVAALANHNQPSSIGNVIGANSTNVWLASNGDATLRHLGAYSSTDWDWTMGSFDVSSPTTATFDIVAGSTLVMNGNAARGAASLQKTGAGTLALNGSNKYEYATIISEGVLSVVNIANGGQASGLGMSSSAPANLVFDGGTLRYAYTLPGYTDRNFTITDGKIAGFDIPNPTTLQMGGSVGPTTGGIQVTGGGSLVLSAQNFYIGPTIVNASTLVVAANSTAFGGPLGIGSDVTLSSGATLDLTNITVTALSIGSLSGDADTKVVFALPQPPDFSPNATLTINSSANATFAGQILYGGGVTKLGGGVQTLTGGNWYLGNTAVQGGTLVISGTNGTINASAAIAISGGATLAVANFGAATSTNRIGDGAPITMGGGTLSFGADADTPDFSETLGALTLAAGYNTVENGQAATNKTSTLTFASLTRTGSAAVNFSGEGLGQSDRNRIFFTTAPTLGDWATYNGVGYAVYDTTNGITETLYTDVTRGNSGQKLIYTATGANVRVIDGTGTPGPVALGAGGITAIHALVQSATNGPVTLDISNGQTFQTMSVLVGSNAGGLTIGAAPNVGHLSSSDSALTPDLRRFTLINNSTNLFVINSSITNAWIYGGPMALALEKLGTGTVVLAGSNAYDGVTTIGQGVLSVSDLSNGGNLGIAVGIPSTLVFAGGTLLYTGTNASTDRSFTVNSAGSRIESSADLHFAGTNGIVLAAGDLTVAGAGNTTISPVMSGAGALRKEGASTLVLGGANTFTGGVTIREGAVSVTNITFGGVAGNLGAAGNATTNLVLDGGTLYFNGAGGGTDRGMSVTANGGRLVNANAGENLVFTLSGNNDIHIANGGTLTVDGPGEVTLQNEITGHGALRKAGEGVLRLQEPINTFTGGVTLSGGILLAGSNLGNGGEVGSLGAASAAPSNLVFDGGTLALTSSSPTNASTDRGFTINAGQTATIALDVNTRLTMSGDVPVTTGALTKTGAGTLALSGNLAFTGKAQVAGGRLDINGTLGPGAVPASSVYVSNNAILGGTGTIQRDVYIAGTHSPGSSPGLQTIDGAIIYDPGAKVVWELAASTTAGRGTNYDGINGNSMHIVHFLGSTALDLVFNAPGSTVKWSDGLWGTNRQWVIYAGFTAVGFTNFVLDPVDWLDSDGALFSELLPESSFSVANIGQEIVLNYQGVPEPSTWALLALSLLGVAGYCSRRR